MREIRTYGSEGGEAPQGAFPTLIQEKLIFKIILLSPKKADSALF